MEQGMLKKLILGFIFLIFFSLCPFSQTNEHSESELDDEIVRTLSSDEYGGRKPGTISMQKSVAFIENYFTNADIKPLFGNTFLDTVSINRNESYNVVGVINGKEGSKEYVLIGAHYDHLGSIKSSTDSVFNGANDNASGVSAVLRIARALTPGRYNKNVIIAIFTGEEKGFIGSSHLAKRLKSIGLNLAYTINFEMIGRPLTSDSTKVYITGFYNSDFANAANTSINYDFIKFEDIDTEYELFSKSDNYPFYEVFHIPSHTLSTYDFKNDAYYHRLKDEYSHLNIKQMNYIIDRSTQIMKALLETDKAITLN